MQDKFNELDTQYKESMVSNAKLYDEKTALVFQVESLKDLLEDRWQEVHETKAESQRIQSVSSESMHVGVRSQGQSHVLFDSLKCGLFLATSTFKTQRRLTWS